MTKLHDTCARISAIKLTPGVGFIFHNVSGRIFLALKINTDESNVDVEFTTATIGPFLNLCPHAHNCFRLAKK